MTEKYLLLNDEIFIFHPETHEVLRVDPQQMVRLDQPDVMRALRLQAREITRQQAEQTVPALGRIQRNAFIPSGDLR